MKNFKQSGYVSLVIIVFVVLLAFLLYPRNHPATTNTVVTTITMPGVLGTERGGFDPSTKKEFKLCAPKVRINKFIPVGKSYFNQDANKEFFSGDGDHNILYQKGFKLPSGGLYDVYYPGKYGEFDNFEIVNGNNGITEFKPYKIIFFINLAEDGTPLLGFGKNVKNETVPHYFVDLYQEEGAPPMPGEGPCSQHLGKTVDFPAQKVSTDKNQQQLQYFDFKSQVEVYSAHCKPAIYLYPNQKMEVSVKVNTKGYLTYTDPPYPKDTGWNVVAYPDGKLEIRNTNSEIRNYLYYESKVPDQLIDTPSKGLVVPYSDLTQTYNYLLLKLGLNEQQTKDFVSYWQRSLPYSPYYFLGIMDQTNINSFEPLEITPKPDQINRVRIYFKALDKKPNLESFQKLDLLAINHQPLTINHFSVVEWGGMVKRDLLHPFTCSE